jgi:hypothetical protein
MKPIFKRFIHFPSAGRPAVIQTDETPAEIQSPLQRTMATASVVCFVALAFVYWAARPVVERLGVWWAEGLVYAIIPITVTFVILYRSGWRRETTGRARIGSLLLLASVIFGGVLLAVCVMVSLAWFGSIAMRAGVGGR